jgi:hypothetical protein
MIYQIPKDVIVHNLIICFSKYELKRIFDTSRELFEEIKYEMIRFKIQANIYFQNHKFRTWLKNKIQIQLHLHYDYDYWDTKEEDLWAQILEEKECRLTVDRGKSLKLQSRKLNRFPIVSIQNNGRIRKFDGPLLQKKIILIWFTGLVDVKNLSRVQELELKGCKNLSDVNALEILQDW